MIFKMKIKLAITALCAALLTGCGVAIKYSLSGASIPPDARTFSVAYFPNNATMVAPILSSTLTDALVDMFTRRTRLMQVEEGGDFAFEGEIINYTSTTASVSSDDYALLNEYERVWGGIPDTESLRTVDTHIARLRKKLGWMDKIETVYKIGYRLKKED